MKSNNFTKPIKKVLRVSNNFSNEINKIIEENKSKSIAELKTIYLNLKLQIDGKKIELNDENINYLTAIKYLVEKKSSRKDFLKILSIAIITPVFSILISLLISLLIKA